MENRLLTDMNVSMENRLPTEIKLDIFSRLPAESVFQCEQVCKTWLALLKSPSFADMHLRRSLELGKVSLLYLHGEVNGINKTLHYGEYYENDEESTKVFKKIIHPPLDMEGNIIGSCNGLICVDESDIDGSIYICNPVTREFVNLPSYESKDIMDTYDLLSMSCGFGYLPATNEYKVVRIIFCQELIKLHERPSGKMVEGYIQVYTLGGGSGWRDKGKMMFSLSGSCFHANGALHWLDGNLNIMALDLADEQFRTLQTPPFVDPNDENPFGADVGLDDDAFLRVLGGNLCAVHRKLNKSIDIWSFRKTASTNLKVGEQQHQIWSWHMEVSIPNRALIMNMYDPFAFTKKNEVLLWYDESGKYPDDYNHNLLFIYDCDQDVSDDGYGSEDGYGYGCGYVHIDQFATAFLHLEAIPHLNSFISLEAIGEGDVNKLPYAEELLESDMSESNSEASSEEDDEYVCDNCKSSWVEEADGEEEYDEDEDEDDEDEG